VSSRGPPVRHSLQMSTKPDTKRVTTATRAGCVRRGMCHITPFSGRGSRNAAEDDPRPNILQLNTEGLTANKICVIEQLAYKNKAFIIVLQETHCTTADKLVIPNFSLVGSVLSRNQGLATFVHERLEWPLVNQSAEQSETKWLCLDVAGHKIINVYKPTRSRFTPVAIPMFPHPNLHVDDFNCQHVNWAYKKHLLTVRSWTPAQHSTTVDCSITQRKQPASSLAAGTSAPTQTWPCEFRPGQPTTGQTCSWEVPSVTTPAFHHNATEAQGSYPQRSGKALKLSQS